MGRFFSAIFAASLLLAIAPVRAAVSGGGVTFRTDFECALQHPVTFVGGTGSEDDPVHFQVKLPGGRQEAGFFAFRLDGVAGKVVRIDMQTDRARNWGTLNPVFAWVWPDQNTDEALADPDLFACMPPPDLEGVKIEGLGGSDIPLTQVHRGEGKAAYFQLWHYMPRSGRKDDVFRVEHAFPALPQGTDAAKAPSVVVAMKVPYTPKLSDALMAGLQARWDKEFADTAETAGNATRRRGQDEAPDWEVVQVGESSGGRPLWLVRIGEAYALPDSGWSWADDSPLRAEPYISRRKQNERPVILFYAREHADEHDTSWVAQGVIDFLLSNHRDARAIRKRCTVLVIPLLDPDGAVANQYETEVIRGYDDDAPVPETLTTATWLRNWVDAGNRLDVVIDLHNVESAEGMHLFPYMYEPPEDGPRARMSQALHRSVVANLPDFDVKPNCGRYGTFRTRLGGWLRKFIGTQMMFYEVNSQAPRRHLSLYELKALGVGILQGVATHLYSAKSRDLRETVQQFRRARYLGWMRYGWMNRLFSPNEDVFDKEGTLQMLPGVEDFYVGDPRTLSNLPDWIQPLLRRTGRRPPPDLLKVLERE